MLPAQIGTRLQSIAATAGDAPSEDAQTVWQFHDRVIYWRMRAEQLRRTADQFVVPSAQDSLRRTADVFERRADFAEARMRQMTSPEVV